MHSKKGCVHRGNLYQLEFLQMMETGGRDRAEGRSNEREIRADKKGKVKLNERQINIYD